MAERYQVTVRRDIGNNLKFPDKCAYCLEASPLDNILIKDKELKGYKLNVPYCKTHATMVRKMKILDKVVYIPILLITILLGIALHNFGVIVIGNTGYNFLAAGLIGVVFYMAVSYLARRLILRMFFTGQGSLDEDGAVKIGMVYADAFILQFHNKTYATEFGQLNYPTPIEATSPQNQSG